MLPKKNFVELFVYTGFTTFPQIFQIYVALGKNEIQKQCNVL